MRILHSWLLCGLIICIFSVALQHPTLARSNTSLSFEDEIILQTQPALVATSTDSVHIPILIYHSVHPSRPNETRTQKQFNVPPEMFEMQLQYLESQGYTSISMDQLIEDIRSGTTTPIQKPIVITFDDGWQDQYTHAFPLLMKYHMQAIFYIYSNPMSRDPRFMTWNEIKELDAAGMTIGSHTITHPYLTMLSPEKLHHEIFDSKTILEEHLGKPVTHFASPFGFINEHIRFLIQEAGYASGRSTRQGSNHSNSDIYKLTGYFAPTDMKNFIWAVAYAQ